MSVNKLWTGIKVIDKDGNEAYVTEEDAEELAQHFSLFREDSFWNFDWDWKFLVTIVYTVATVLGIVAML